MDPILIQAAATITAARITARATLAGGPQSGNTATRTFETEDEALTADFVAVYRAIRGALKRMDEEEAEAAVTAVKAAHPSGD